MHLSQHFKCHLSQTWYTVCVIKILEANQPFQRMSPAVTTWGHSQSEFGIYITATATHQRMNIKGISSSGYRLQSIPPVDPPCTQLYNQLGTNISNVSAGMSNFKSVKLWNNKQLLIFITKIIQNTLKHFLHSKCCNQNVNFSKIKQVRGYYYYKKESWHFTLVNTSSLSGNVNQL